MELTKVRHHQWRKKRRNEKAIKMRDGFGEQRNVSDDGNIFTLETTHHLVDGTSGSSQEQMMAARFTFDSGAGFNIVRKSVLPPGWESEVVGRARPPNLTDANGSPFSSEKIV